MDHKEATRTCGQCHKEVSEANFALHETHCSRFLCVCPGCDEAVPIEKLEQHRQEEHTQVKCSKCNQKLERRDLKDHEAAECVERLQICRFCELELPWKALWRHSEACGCRTEACGSCRRYVMLKDGPGHRLTCPGPPPAAGTSLSEMTITVNCSRCAASFPAEDIEEHELDCVIASWQDDDENSEDEEDFSMQGTTARPSAAYRGTFSPFRPRHDPWTDGRERHQISTCRHCDLALPLVTLHEVKCQRYILLK